MTTPPGGTLRVLFVGTKEDAARTNGQLRRAGYDDKFVHDVARVMEYHRAWELYRDDIEFAAPAH